MEKLPRLILNPAVRIIICIVGFVFSGCTPLHTFWYNMPGHRDIHLFKNRPLIATNPTPFITADSNITLPPPILWGNHRYLKYKHTPEQYLHRTKTYALLILRNDTLVYQYYAPNFNRASELTSFSVAKGILSLLAGIAIDEKKLNLEDSVSEWLLLWRNRPSFAPIQIKHLLQMTSGLNFRDEYVNPFGGAARFYYGKNLRQKVLNLKPKYMPGTVYRYKSCDPILISMILEKATGKSVTEYLQEKIWNPCGMQFSGSWSLDGGFQPIEKSFCGLNAKPEDLLRLGQVMLHQGKYNQKQIIPPKWLQEIQHIDGREASPRFYQYYWYLSAESTDYFAEGINGQLLYISPSTQTVIVRLGSQIDWHWRDNLGNLAGSCSKKIPIKITPSHRLIAGSYIFSVSDSGDTSMLGKKAKFWISGNRLYIKTDIHKTFSAFPYQEKSFYDPKNQRNLQFLLNDSGQIDHILWTRGRQTWKLLPEIQ
ncbi:MAG: beta-lactamase family protein [Bacteroidia bacterium]|nr:beta-lactamase family protein [Bacteroidia bacterium]